MSNKVYQEITDKIIEQLKKGCIPWEQPWFGSNGPISYATGRQYSFLNKLVLQGEPTEFLTWHQIQQHNGHLRKGSKGRRVFFWATFDKAETNDKGETVIKQIPYLKTYTVFRIDDCDGIQPRWQTKTNSTTNTPIKQAEETVSCYLSREKIELKNIRNEAYYSVRYDYINIPVINNFKSSEDYYSTLLHEIIHSTGNQKRLGRFKANDTSSPFGSPDYSREELVAEMGCSFLLHHLGISNTRTLEQNAAYIRSWLTALSNDVSLIAIAATRAERAAQYVLSQAA